MIHERFAPLTCLRCLCGRIYAGDISKELERFFLESPKPTDYALVERLTGFHAIFPERPASKLVWVCPACWTSVQEHAAEIAKKLGGLWTFSLTQLNSLSHEEREDAVTRFLIGTNKWRENTACHRCAAPRGPEDKCTQCGYEFKKRKQELWASPPRGRRPLLFSKFAKVFYL